MSFWPRLFGKKTAAAPVDGQAAVDRPFDLAADIRERLEATGAFRPDATTWIAEAADRALQEGHGYPKACQAITRAGEPLSADALKRLGLNPRMKVGRGYIDAVATSDYRSSMDLLEEVISTASSSASHRRNLDQMEAAGIERCKLSSPQDERETAIERQYDDREISIDEARGLLQTHERDLRRSVFAGVVVW